MGEGIDLSPIPIDLPRQTPDLFAQASYPRVHTVLYGLTLAKILQQ